ncbi:copper chaperone PCu(A)C [uncultured Roseovarius sp.]|uniref:copper chaperone PCu(A)C n=1 Tax=uncultured Roseovarius sp. TaxID=293344 RepID=UPI002593AB3E|nr:copper chaperone PCu(A)C [uncultured Roseovarius sp.]
MSFKSTILAAVAASAFALPAFAADIMVQDPYARSSAMMATSGAAFMQIMNHGESDDRLIGAASPVAEMVQLHTHKEDENGVMRMLHVEEGFPVAAGETLMLARGGNHVMFMGITEPFEQGDMIPLTLTFEKAGDITVEVPVDLERQPMHGMKHQHGKSE